MSTVEKKNIDVLIQSQGSAALQKIRELISTAGVDVRGFGSGEQLLSMLNVDLPSVAVFDALLADTTAYQLVQKIKSTPYAISPIVIVKSTEARTAIRFLQDGKALVVPDDSDQVEVWEVLTLAKQQAQEDYLVQQARKYWELKLDRCTRDEREVLKLWSEGKSNKQMTGVLDIAPRTLQLRKKALLDKLEAVSIFVVIRELNRLGIEKTYLA